jgi:tetratricopeptide (TPR) repeat protein
MEKHGELWKVGKLNSKKKKVFKRKS